MLSVILCAQLLQTLLITAAVSCCPAAVLMCAGKETINTLYGTRVAVLAGDFLFAQSSWLIANLENMEVGEAACFYSSRGCAGWARLVHC